MLLKLKSLCLQGQAYGHRAVILFTGNTQGSILSFTWSPVPSPRWFRIDPRILQKNASVRQPWRCPMAEVAVLMAEVAVLNVGCSKRPLFGVSDLGSSEQSLMGATNPNAVARLKNLHKTLRIRRRTRDTSLMAYAAGNGNNKASQTVHTRPA